ncbi:tail assembly chaperone [Gordonia phage Clown]|uniref:Tail assembly chaperone n=1 Tax=Gordonia phage Clown TaxID=2759393 RepID=A0A7L7SLG8_9CAUD|nr:HK97 gp10 family protein [Gordonia phage Clown]QOC56028.1 tail assembly chaperone [Gordonia phage Clown]
MPVEIHHHTIDQDTRLAGERWGNRVGREVTNAAKRRAPVDEGTLRASIDYTLEWAPDSVHVTVGSPLDYAEYWHTGTGIYGPHGTPIVPVTRQALKFRWEPTAPGAKKQLPKEKRGWYFAKSVKGIEPNPFLIDALKDVMGTIDLLR